MLCRNQRQPRTSKGFARRFGRSANFGAFGEVLAENLTRCHTESFHDYNLVIFSVAFGEILDQNLTKCLKNDSEKGNDEKVYDDSGIF